MIKLLKESYGDLSDYLERHLDSWYGRLNELQEAIEDLGLDVEEINNEYVIVHAAEPDGEDVYCKIWLGGTPRTISLETFEMLESVRRSRNVLREYNNKIAATTNEGNVLGMGGGYPNVYLPKAAKEYLKRKGFQEVDTEIGPCFYMRFPGNEVWEIYIDEQYGGIYVVQEGYELKPTDDIATIDDYDYKDDIDAVINLGNCLSNGEDFDSCLQAFFK